MVVWVEHFFNLLKSCQITVMIKTKQMDKLQLKPYKAHGPYCLSNSSQVCILNPATLNLYNSEIHINFIRKITYMYKQ